MNQYLIIWILFFLVLSSLFGYFLYYYRVKQPAKIDLLLAIIRSLVFFLVLILLVNPSITKKVLSSQKTKLSVLVDNSSSIKFFKKDSLITHILGSLKNDKKLNDNFKINYYSFGSTFKLSDTFSFDEYQTDISVPLERISKLQNNTIHPIILISDGNQTIGNDYQYTSINDPVFPIVVGDTSMNNDVRISQINVNRYSFINNKFPIETILQYEGIKPVKLRYSIENNGKVIFSKLLNFSEKNNSQILRNYIKATQEGLNLFKSKIEYLKNEKNIVNNSKIFQVDVINKQSQILIVSSFYHPDLGALKKAIESDKQCKVSIKITGNDDIQINDYQLIVLYQPTKEFNSLLNQLNSNKSSFFMITGSKTDWSYINNKSLGINKKYINQLEKYTPVFNTSFLTFSQNNIGFENYPPLSDYFGEVLISIPHQTLLFQNINGYLSQMPLLINSNENNQKKVFLFGEGIWKWRSSSFQTYNTFKYFDRFIGNIILYASNNKIRDRLDIDIKSSYNINSEISINAFYVDENYQFDNRATLLFTLLNKNTNQKRTLPFSLSNASYQLNLSSLDPGKYEYIISVDGQNISKKGKFVVNDFFVEKQFTRANSDKLDLLAKKTKGELYFEDNYNLLVDRLVNDKKFEIQNRSIEIISNPINFRWIMILLIFLLSIEWLIRKYMGKV